MHDTFFYCSMSSANSHSDDEWAVIREVADAPYHPTCPAGVQRKRTVSETDKAHHVASVHEDAKRFKTG